MNNILFKIRNEEVKNIISKFHLTKHKGEFVKICKCESKNNYISKKRDFYKIKRRKNDKNIL